VITAVRLADAGTCTVPICTVVWLSVHVPTCVRYLTEHKEVELNMRDVWDSTPLYYACLCGHKELVEYLLNRWVICLSWILVSVYGTYTYVPDPEHFCTDLDIIF